jgi:hypothetical protein
MAKNNNMLSKSGIKGNKWHLFKTHWLSKSAISRLRRSKRALLVIVLLASSAAALTSLGVWRAIRPTPSLAHGATAASPANKASEPPATVDPPLTKLREYVYAGGRLITRVRRNLVFLLSVLPARVRHRVAEPDPSTFPPRPDAIGLPPAMSVGSPSPQGQAAPASGR